MRHVKIEILDHGDTENTEKSKREISLRVFSVFSVSPWLSQVEVIDNSDT
jgi:hypothetical protein